MHIPTIYPIGKWPNFSNKLQKKIMATDSSQVDWYGLKTLEPSQKEMEAGRFFFLPEGTAAHSQRRQLMTEKVSNFTLLNYQVTKFDPDISVDPGPHGHFHTAPQIFTLVSA